MSTILIKNGSVITLNDEKQTFKQGYVLIENDLIVDVGAGDPPNAWHGQCAYPSISDIYSRIGGR